MVLFDKYKLLTKLYYSTLLRACMSVQKRIAGRQSLKLAKCVIKWLKKYPISFWITNELMLISSALNDVFLAFSLFYMEDKKVRLLIFLFYVIN